MAQNETIHTDSLFWKDIAKQWSKKVKYVSSIIPKISPIDHNNETEDNFDPFNPDEI